jgi:hypothetical protein
VICIYCILLSAFIGQCVERHEWHKIRRVKMSLET